VRQEQPFRNDGPRVTEIKAQAVFEVVNARVLSHGQEEHVAERAAQLLAQGG
jgi:hypothetical protein